MHGVEGALVAGFLGIMLCIILTAGIGGIWSGLCARPGRAIGERGIQRWRRQLARLGVWRQETPEEERELIVRWVRSQADWQIFVSTGALVGLGAVAVIGALTRDLLFSSFYSVFSLIFLPCMFLSLLVMCAFYMSRTSRAPTRTMAGSLSHYRPRSVPVITASIGLIYLALVALQAMDILPRGEGMSPLNRLPPDDYWLLWIAPALALCAVAVSEYTIRKVLLLPDESLAEEPGLRTRANAALRKQRILGIESVIIYMGSLCAFSEGSLLPLPPDPFVVTLLPFILMFAGAACMFILVALQAGWGAPDGGGAAAA